MAPPSGFDRLGGGGGYCDVEPGPGVVLAKMWRGALIAAGLLLAGSATTGLLPAGSNAVTGAGRVSHSSAGPQCAAGYAMNTLGAPAIQTSSTPPRRWSAPAPLVPAGTPTGSLGLAATAAGSVLAGWVQGPPPVVSVGGPGRAGLRHSRAGTLARASTQEVRVAEGSVLGGFRGWGVLAVARSGSLLNLHVTLASPGVGYVVWEGPSTTLRLGVICGGRIAVSNRRLISGAVPLALFPLSGGRAAVVFDKYGHGTPFLEYGLLSAAGRIGKLARIAHPGSRDTAATEVSVNARGELIAAWVHDDGASPPGTSPGSARFVAAKLVVARCRPALHCGSPETIGLGRTKPACINPAVAISPRGAATVIAAAADWHTGCDKPLGVWASVTSARAANLQPMREIETKGDWPIAQPVGRAGTAMVFNSGLAASDSFASSFLPAAGVARSQTSLLDHGGFWNTGQQLLAPANNGWYVITWSHANRRANPDISLNAVVGHDGQLQRSLVAVGATRHISTYLGATDGHGDAMILFNGSTDTGNGAAWPYTSGLYTTVRRG